jgi:hypothetical protein
MSKISERILPFLRGGNIEYAMFGSGIRTMSLKQFEANYQLIAYSEMPEKGIYSYYHQNVETPDLLMYIRATEEGYAAMLAQYRDADECFLHLEENLGFTRTDT